MILFSLEYLIAMFYPPAASDRVPRHISNSTKESYNQRRVG